LLCIFKNINIFFSKLTFLRLFFCENGIFLNYADDNKIGGVETENTIRNNVVGILINRCIYYNHKLKNNNEFENNSIDIKINLI